MRWLLVLLLTGCAPTYTASVTTPQGDYHVRNKCDSIFEVTLPDGTHIISDDKPPSKQPGVLRDLLGILAIKEVD